jgi:taurine dioxygenase
MCAAYDDSPQDMQQSLEGKTALHDFAKFYDMMRMRPGSIRPPLSAAQRATKPPVSRPMVITRPISKRRALYANPGYTIHIGYCKRKATRCWISCSPIGCRRNIVKRSIDEG